MADNQATHLYVVLQGSYRTAALTGEVWQTGLRFATRPGNTAPADTGDFVPFGVVAANHNIVETDWTISGNWTTEMGVSDLNPADWLNDQICPAAKALITSANFSSDVQLDAALVYPIRSPDGKVQPAIPYSQGSPVRADFTGTKPSGGGAQSVPLQISCAAGLRTSQTGRRGRGRMFLPPAPNSYLGNGLLDVCGCLSAEYLGEGLHRGPQARRDRPWRRVCLTLHHWCALYRILTDQSAQN